MIRSHYWRSYLRWVTDHPFAVIGVVAAVGVALILAASGLKVKNLKSLWLPAGHPYVETTRLVHEVFGGHDLVVIGVAPTKGDVYQPEVLERIARIERKVRALPEALKNNVVSLGARKVKAMKGSPEGLEVRRLLETVPQTPQQFDRLRQAVRENPFYVGALVSGDARFAAVIADIKLPQDALGYTDVNARLQRIAESERAPGIEVFTGGSAVGFAAIEHYSNAGAAYFAVAFIIIMAVQYASFRSFQGMLLPMLTGGLSVLAGLGALALCGFDLDVLNTTTPILVMAITSGHAIQLLKRYYEEFRRLARDGDGDATVSPKALSREAIVESLARVGSVTAAAGIVAAVTFFSLGLAHISMIRHFGLFAGVGVLSGLVLELTLIPALRAVLPPPRPNQPAEETQRASRGGARLLDRMLLACSDLLLSGRARWVVLGGIALMIGVGAGITRLRVDNSTMQYLGPGNAARHDDQAINRALGGTNTAYFLIETKRRDGLKDPAVLRAMDRLQTFLDRQPGVGKTQSFVDLVKRMNQAMHADDPARFEVPPSRELIAQYLLLYSLSGDPDDFENYIDGDYARALVWVFLRNDSTADAEALFARARPLLAAFPEGVTVRIGGSLAEQAAINEVVVREKIENTVQMAVVIFVLTSLMLRSLTAGLFVLIPVLFIIAANFGAMGWLGIPLDMGTATSASMAIGIGADYELYLLYRFREELRRGSSLKVAMEQSLLTSGKAIVFVALAIIGGYSVLFASDFVFYSRLATAVIVTMLISALSAVVFLRALMMAFRPRFIFGSAAAAGAGAGRSVGDVATSER